MSVRILSYRSLKGTVTTLIFAPVSRWNSGARRWSGSAMDAAHPRNRRLVMLSSSHARSASRADLADGAGIHRCLAATLGRQAPSSGGLTVGQQTSNV